MSQRILPRLAPTPDLLRRQCTNPHLSGEVRLALWCWGHVNASGHAPARPGQLLTELGFSSMTEVSRVLAKARDHGLIDVVSNARCVVLPGHGLAPCDAIHRGAA